MWKPRISWRSRCFANVPVATPTSHRGFHRLTVRLTSLVPVTAQPGYHSLLLRHYKFRFESKMKCRRLRLAGKFSRCVCACECVLWLDSLLLTLTAVRTILPILQCSSTLMVFTILRLRNLEQVHFESISISNHSHSDATGYWFSVLSQRFPLRYSNALVTTDQATPLVSNRIHISLPCHWDLNQPHLHPNESIHFACHGMEKWTAPCLNPVVGISWNLCGFYVVTSKSVLFWYYFCRIQSYMGWFGMVHTFQLCLCRTRSVHLKSITATTIWWRTESLLVLEYGESSVVGATCPFPGTKCSHWRVLATAGPIGSIILLYK